MTDPMAGYERRDFEAPLRDGTPIRHDVYERGEGRPVILIQELPGIGQETLRLADRLVGAGHRVVVPHLFGPLGRVAMLGNVGRIFCMREELHLFAKRASSPIVDWLAALCRDVRDRSGARGVGVIGMCLTGNFAITLIGDDSVLAAVASQPAMPFAGPGSLHMSREEIAAVCRRLDEHGPMLAYRFKGDPLVTKKKFAAIDRAFNEGRERIRLKVPARRRALGAHARLRRRRGPPDAAGAGRDLGLLRPEAVMHGVPRMQRVGGCDGAAGGVHTSARRAGTIAIGRAQKVFGARRAPGCTRARAYEGLDHGRPPDGPCAGAVLGRHGRPPRLHRG